MNSEERPSEQREPSIPIPRPRGNGRSGKGADSAMKQMREWEQRRARDRVLPPRDKPAL